MSERKMDFESRIDEAKKALSELGTPDPSSSRQVIIACRQEILACVKSHGWAVVHQTFVDLGHAVTLGTFKDYVYKGGASKQGRTAAKDIKRRKARSASAGAPQAEAVTMPPNATQATAAGTAVLARKMT